MVARGPGLVRALLVFSRSFPRVARPPGVLPRGGGLSLVPRREGALPRLTPVPLREWGKKTFSQRYPATVVAFDARMMKHTLAYDDGDVEALQLWSPRTTARVLSDPMEWPSLAARLRAGRESVLRSLRARGVVVGGSASGGSQQPRFLAEVATLPEGVEMVMPGDNVALTVELITPIAMEKELRFAIREGGRTVGAGVISDILE